MSYSTLAVNVALGSVPSYTVSENAPKPVWALSFGGTVTRSKAASLIVVSEELLRAPAAPAMLEAELRRSISAGVNAAFLDLVSAAGDTMAAAGTTAANIATTLTAAMQLIGVSARSRFTWRSRRDARAACAHDRYGGRARPSPTCW